MRLDKRLPLPSIRSPASRSRPDLKQAAEVEDGQRYSRILCEGRNDMPKKYTGRCACGQVTYGFDTEPALTANCHCTDCKRASGAEMTTWVVVPDTDFT